MLLDSINERSPSFCNQRSRPLLGMKKNAGSLFRPGRHFYVVTLVYPDFEDTVHFICKLTFFYQNTLLLLHIY